MKKFNFIITSIVKKFLMAITGFFLMLFLLVHLSINFFLFRGEESFNKISYFMANNPLIQILQYILAISFIIHIFFSIKIHFQNKIARGKINYAVNKWRFNTSFNARTMIYSGLLVLCFLILHLKDFTIPIKINNIKELNNYQLVVKYFKNPIYTITYLISFILLAIHLSHGFQSSFQSIGVYKKKYIFFIKKLGILYFWFISMGFSFIALWFFFKK